MGRLSDLVTLYSQSSQMLQSNHIHDLNRELHSVKQISVDILRDITNILGRSLKLNIEIVKKKDILRDAIDIAELCFNKALDEATLPSDSLLKPTLDNLIEPLGKLNHNGMFPLNTESSVVACTLVELFLPKLLDSVANQEFDLVGRLDMITFLNLMLAEIPSTMRGSLWSSRKLNPFICRFGGTLASLGDFDLQANAAAALLRLIPHRFQSQFAAANIMNGNSHLADHFANMGGSIFESLGSPSTSGDIYAKFWVDFNLPTERITTYCISPFNEPDTQFSCTVEPTQAKWEILTIHPEDIEALDIRVANQLTTLKLTMSQPIRDICDWAHSISCNTITFNIELNALATELSSVTFTQSLPEEETGEVRLIRILQYLKSVVCKMTSLTETPTSLPSIAPGHESITISPVVIPSKRSCLQKLIKAPTPDCSFGRDIFFKVDMTTSPIICNRYDNQVTSESNETIPRVTQTCINETEKCRQNEESLLAPASNGLVNSTTVNLALPTSSDVKEFSQTNQSSPVVGSVTPIKCSNEQYILEDRDYHMTQQRSSMEIAVENLLSNVILSHAHVTDLDESPERQRAAPLYPSPIPSRILEEPQLTIQAAIHSPPDLSSAKQVSMPLSKLSPLSLVGDAAKVNEGATLSSLESSPFVFHPTSPRALGILSSAATSSVNSCKSTGSFPCDPVEITVDIGPPISPLMHEQLLYTETLNSGQEEVQKPSCLSKGRKRTAATTQRSPLRPVTSLNTPESQDSSSLQLLTPSTATSPSPLLAKPRGPPDGVTSVGSSNAGFRLTARRLCNTSVSYLTDLSPANPHMSLTPVQCNDISLPNLSAVVHMPSRTKMMEVQNKKIKRQNTCVGGTLFDASPAGQPSSDTDDDDDDDDDDDYLPGSAKRWGTAVATRRRSRRLSDKQATTSVPKAAETVKSTPPALTLKPNPRGRQSHTPERRSPFTGSIHPRPASPQTPSENSSVSVVPNPLSVLKKRRFFATSRLDRMDRERERFEEAISKRTKKKKPNQKKQKKCTDKVTTTIPHDAPDVSDAPAPPPRRRQPARIVPSRKAALQAATDRNAMPTDSDTEFHPEITDSQVGSCRQPLSIQRLDSVPETSQLVMPTNLDIIPSSWEPEIFPLTSDAKNDNYNDTPFVMSSMETVETSSSSLPCSQQHLTEPDSPELFAQTPPAKQRNKLRQNDKSMKTDHPSLPVPLKFVGADDRNPTTTTTSIPSCNQLDSRLQLQENSQSEPQQSLQSLIVESMDDGHAEPEIPRNNRRIVGTDLDISINASLMDMHDSEAYAELIKAVTIGSHDVHISNEEFRSQITTALIELTQFVAATSHNMKEALSSHHKLNKRFTDINQNLDIAQQRIESLQAFVSQAAV